MKALYRPGTELFGRAVPQTTAQWGNQTSTMRMKGLQMAQRTAVVTGGMGGLGESISTKMHDAGYRVVVTHSPGNANADNWVKQMKARDYNF